MFLFFFILDFFFFAEKKLCFCFKIREFIFYVFFYQQIEFIHITAVPFIVNMAIDVLLIDVCRLTLSINEHYHHLERKNWCFDFCIFQITIAEKVQWLHKKCIPKSCKQFSVVAVCCKMVMCCTVVNKINVRNPRKKKISQSIRQCTVLPE